jgi:hypothetical protein
LSFALKLPYYYTKEAAASQSRQKKKGEKDEKTPLP